MCAAPAADERCAVPVVIELDHSFSRALDPTDALHRRLVAELDDELSGLMRTLGVPGELRVSLRSLPERASPAGRILRVTVHGETCRYPDQLLHDAHRYMSGTLSGDVVSGGELFAWLRSLHDGAPAAGDESLCEFFRLVVIEAIKLRPAVLLAAPQAEAYRAALTSAHGETSEAEGQDPGSLPDAASLGAALRDALDLHLSIADRQTVAQTLRETFYEDEAKRDAEKKGDARNPAVRREIAESLIAALSPNVVEIELPPFYLKQITLADGGGAREILALLRADLFQELGSRLPELRFHTTNALKPSTFRFKVNHLTTLPRVGLRAEQYLVPGTPEELGRSGIEGAAAFNPYSAIACTVVETKDKETATARGLTTLGALDYVLLSLGGELKRSAGRLLHRQIVEADLEALEAVLPVLVQAVRGKFSVAQLTGVARTLLEEQIPVRDLKSILEQILDYDYVVADSLRHIVFDDRLSVGEQPDQAWLDDPVHVASYARTKMKRTITHKFTRGSNTLLVYLLSYDFERMLAANIVYSHRDADAAPPAPDSRFDERSQQMVMDALRAEIEYLPATADLPVVLVSPFARRLLRDIIAPEFPDLHVLSYEELTRETNIQPIARIIPPGA